MRQHTKVGALVAGAALISAAALATPASAGNNLGGAPIPAGSTPVNLLTVNDFHGRIDSGDLTGKLGKNFACTMITQRAALGASNTVTVGAGDLINASTFASQVQHEEPTIDFLGAVGLQVSSVGNHEFDSGFADLTGRIIPRAHEHGFEYVGANIYTKGTKTPAMKSYEVYTVNGVRVGVVGAVTAETPNLVAGLGIAGLDFGDPVEGANTVVNQLTDGDAANGEADVVVVAYHEGGPYSSTTGTLADQMKVPVFAHLVNDTSPKAAAIIQGHTHQAYVYDLPVPGAIDGSTRPVLQTGNYAANVGKIQFGIDTSTMKVVGYNAGNVPVVAYSPTCAADAQWQRAAAIVDAAVTYAKPIAAQPVGKITTSITRAYNNGAEDRGRESSLSNLIAQQMVESVNATGNNHADIGIMNPGGVRNDLPYGTDGTITYGQAAAILPFGNTLKTADYTGAQVKRILEEQWQPVSASRPFLALGLSKNVTYTYDPNRAQGDRISGIYLDGTPIDPAKVYSVTSSSFLVTNVGTAPDNFATMLQGANYRDTGLSDGNAFVDWLKANSPVSPSWVQHGVGVIGTPAVTGSKNGPQTITMRLEGFDLTSLGSPANSTASIRINGTEVATATITPVINTTPIPSRKGVAEISFTLTKQQLLPWTKGNGHRDVDVMISVVADPTGTVAYVPMKVSKG